MKKFFLLLTVFFFGASLIKAETVTCYIDKYNYDTESYEAAFQSFTTELTVDENGVYTLADFFNSGCPVSWTLSPVEGVGYDNMTFADNCYYTPSDDTYKWFFDYTNNEYAVCKGFLEANSEDSVTFSYTYLEEEGDSYSEASAIEGYKCYSSINVYSQSDDTAYNNYYYISFYHNVDASSGIADAAVDENCPAEYYNLQGVRINNPSNGLYICRKGNATTKVYVK